MKPQNPELHFPFSDEFSGTLNWIYPTPRGNRYLDTKCTMSGKTIPWIYYSWNWRPSFFGLTLFSTWLKGKARPRMNFLQTNTLFQETTNSNTPNYWSGSRP